MSEKDYDFFINNLLNINQDKNIKNDDSLPLNLSEIYSKLSIEINLENSQNNEDYIFILDKINKTFNKKLLNIETSLLQKKPDLIAEALLKLIKSCDESNFKKIGLIFINFCDYFNLLYHTTYQKLPPKLQALIIKECKKLIGFKVYRRYEKKQIEENLNNNISLFDL